MSAPVNDKHRELARHCVAEWYRTSIHDPLESGNLDALTDCIAATIADAEARGRADGIREAHAQLKNTWAQEEAEERILALLQDDEVKCTAWDATNGLRCITDGCKHNAIVGFVCPCHEAP